VLSVAPVRLASRVSLTGMLAQGARGSSRPGARLRTGLAVVQLALSLTLLAGGLLFVQTLHNLRGVDLGFNPAGVTTLQFPLRGQGYDSPRSMQFYRDLLARLAPQPGVDAVAAAMSPPLLGGSFRREVHLPGRDPKTESVEVLTNDVTADYFGVFEIDLVAGRTFTAEEAFATGPEPGIVISRSLAERLFGTPNAVGQLVTFPAVYGAPSHEVPVIGVAEDTKWRGIDKAADLLVYRPVGDSVNNSMLVIRSAQPADAVRLVRDEVARLDPSLPVGTDLSMASIIDRRLSQQRLFAWVLGVLAALGFVLAAIGVHGLTSQMARERWREFGLRLAIGATRGDIVRLVLRGGLTVVALGVPLGIGAAALASGAIESQLFGVERLAPSVYLGAALTLLVVVLLASLLPALRAARTNPVDVLRVE
jgi:predicted permease